MTEATQEQASFKDGALVNALLGLGTVKDRSIVTKYSYPTLLTDEELTAAFLVDGLARKIVSLPASEALRPGLEVSNVSDAGALMSSFNRLNALEAFEEALQWSFMADLRL